MVLSTAKHTPCWYGSLGTFACQKNMYSSYRRDPVEANFASSRAVMSILSVLRSRPLMALFFESSIFGDRSINL